MVHRLVAVFLSLMLPATAALVGQDTPPALNATRRAAVVDSIARVLNERYVFPEVADRMRADLQARRADGSYEAVVDPEAFANLLTEHLQAVSHDKHLRVRVGGSRPLGGPAGRPAGSASIFGHTERMEGNVAYVEIRSFGVPPDAVREATQEVMSTAADASAMIVDLRQNGGGSPHTVALVTSYLFGDEPVHLNSLYFRPTDRTDHFYTDPNVPGRKFGPDKPIYVLTSEFTFSGAEEFAYNLQTRERAVIVGETTGGGAHPGGPVPLPEGLTMFVPTGRAINPITQTNWEGVGVKPDVATPADAALETAHRLALKRIADCRLQNADCRM